MDGKHLMVIRNRFRLVEGLVDSRFNLIHDAVYFITGSGLTSFMKKKRKQEAEY
jgi:hypothetical protein